MQTFKWIGGSVLDQGRFEDASEWDNLTTGTIGVTAPQAGDVGDITGVVNASIYRLGALYVFPLGGGYPLIQFEAAQDPNVLLTNPDAVVGYTVQGGR